MMPSPPARVTAAASAPPATLPIGASRIGCSIPNIRVIDVVIAIANTPLAPRLSQMSLPAELLPAGPSPVPHRSGLGDLCKIVGLLRPCGEINPHGQTTRLAIQQSKGSALRRDDLAGDRQT